MVMIYIISFIIAIVFIVVGALISWDDNTNDLNILDKKLWIMCIIAILIVLQSLYTGPMYNVWKKQLDGRAELAQAEWNRKIVIEEAKAKEESAKSWAAAEVIRAKGSDEANEIMKKSLGGNENYLRWLWIEKMDKLNGQVIYLPADGGIPIMEAAKRK
jgi:hypothetical protein